MASNDSDNDCENTAPKYKVPAAATVEEMLRKDEGLCFLPHIDRHNRFIIYNFIPENINLKLFITQQMYC